MHFFFLGSFAINHLKKKKQAEAASQAAEAEARAAEQRSREADLKSKAAQSQAQAAEAGFFIILFASLFFFFGFCLLGIKILKKKNPNR